MKFNISPNIKYYIKEGIPLNGFEYVVNGTTYNVPELRKISPDTNREADRLEAHIAKQYVAYMERQKAAPYVKAVENLINRKYRKYGK